MEVEDMCPWALRWPECQKNSRSLSRKVAGGVDTCSTVVKKCQGPL